jgi:hypothetical protein
MISSRADNRTSKCKSGPDWVSDAPWERYSTMSLEWSVQSQCSVKPEIQISLFRKTGTPLEIHLYLWVSSNSWVRIFLPLRYTLASADRREQVDNKGENVKCKDEGSDFVGQHLIASPLGTETYPIPEQRLRPSFWEFLTSCRYQTQWLLRFREQRIELLCRNWLTISVSVVDRNDRSICTQDRPGWRSSHSSLCKSVSQFHLTRRYLCSHEHDQETIV